MQAVRRSNGPLGGAGVCTLHDPNHTTPLSFHEKVDRVVPGSCQVSTQRRVQKRRDGAGRTGGKGSPRAAVDDTPRENTLQPKRRWKGKKGGSKRRHGLAWLGWRLSQEEDGGAAQGQMLHYLESLARTTDPTIRSSWPSPPSQH